MTAKLAHASPRRCGILVRTVARRFIEMMYGHGHKCLCLDRQCHLWPMCESVERRTAEGSRMEKPARTMTVHTMPDALGRCQLTLTWPVTYIPGWPLAPEGTWYERGQVFFTKPENFEAWLQGAVMHIQLDFPLGTVVRVCHPVEGTRQEGIVIGYCEQGGCSIRFRRAGDIYDIAEATMRDRTAVTCVRKGLGRL